MSAPEDGHRDASADDSASPVFQVSGGNPSDDELAAAIAVLSVALAPRPRPRAASDRPKVGGWNSYHRVIRPPHQPGAGAWGARL